MTAPPSTLVNRPPIGRFAPSPTGQLHLGSLFVALASYAHAKSLGGQWFVRIEDTDFERCKPQYTDKILSDLETLGLHWDGKVIYQSQRLAIYHHYLDVLQNRLYACACSRKTLATFGAVYPRFCLHKGVDKHQKWRLMLPDTHFCFVDEYQGTQWQNPQKLLGDTVIKRQNGMINYIFACAIDDGLMNVNSLVRGLDILPMTMTQTVIQQQLALPTPSHFAHLPLLVDSDGQKLSKQTLATPIDTTKPSRELCFVLSLLGMPIDDELPHQSPAKIVQFAVDNWWGDWQQHLQHKTKLTINHAPLHKIP